MLFKFPQVMFLTSQQSECLNKDVTYCSWVDW